MIVPASNLLARPLTLPNGTVLANRIAKSAMSEALGSWTNHVTPQLPRLYERWARSGPGLLITGNVMIDRRALGEPGNVVLEDDADLPLLRQWAHAASDHGVALWMQLNHPGKQSPKGLNRDPVAPSAIPFRKDLQAFFDAPRELRVDEIHDLILRFGRAAEIAREAGFGGVQIHGAHGYLVSQFLSPHHNQRTDEWGGSAEKRRRFVLAVYAEIRRRVGADFPVGIKLNSADFQRGGFTEDESMDVIRALDAAGIDLVEISGGTYEVPVMTGTTAETRKPSTIAREAYFLDFAERIRSGVKAPLMVTGGFRSFAGMNTALASGAFDLVGLGRLVAMDPDAPAALLRGQDSACQVRPIKTGIGLVDRTALLEVTWYARQLKRMANGGEPHADESAVRALLGTVWHSGWGTFRTRQRA
ncbi:MAG: NADH:flavin oxidoreductase/NADH oxidase family protein [Nevskiaceae bacterium]|nr:MAG: NADH:flavin oxidoreductase/NADH oxidase family protein [Nevskiaceae bacterium]TBR74436.1 MAG: NADH:flavin oxidoreductase/NADH oxidase family protein [Nevskiaceae bacterium]